MTMKLLIRRGGMNSTIYIPQSYGVSTENVIPLNEKYNYCTSLLSVNALIGSSFEINFYEITASDADRNIEHGYSL